MVEPEVETPEDAAHFVAHEVVNEYHSFPVVQVDGSPEPATMYIQINNKWFRADFMEVTAPDYISQLEELVK